MICIDSLVLAISPQGTSNEPDLGFAGYVNSLSDLQNTINIMESLDCNTYRVTSRPSWQIADGEVHGYNIEWIDYLLANTDFFIIVDGNHLYPAGEEMASEARTHWSEVENRIFQILSRYGNNSRVAVELINEYVSSDFYLRMQSLVSQIRDAGYSNPIVVNKSAQVWERIVDPLNNTYQGMHFYFNTWSVEDAISQMNFAANTHSLKLINTEIGASSNEYKDFTQNMVNKVSSFLLQCNDLGYGNCLWMNNDTLNWPTYEQYDLQLVPPQPTPTPAPTATPLQIISISPTEIVIPTTNKVIEVEFDVSGGTPPYSIILEDDVNHILEWSIDSDILTMHIKRAEKHDRGFKLEGYVTDSSLGSVFWTIPVTFTLSTFNTPPPSSPSPTPTSSPISTESPPPITNFNITGEVILILGVACLGFIGFIKIKKKRN